jgi:hypothetical protein
MRDDEKVFKHESYAMAGFSRVSAHPGAFLFGSDFRHGNYMTLTISRAERLRSLSKDWFHSYEQLIQIALSESQFCEMITRPNMGDGVPVTLTRFGGKLVKEPPSPEVIGEEFVKDMKADTEACVKDLRAAIGVLHEAIESGKVGKTALRDIEKQLEYAACAVDRGIPFVENQFRRSVEHVVGRAKTEIEAHVSAVAMRIGVDAMRLEAKNSAPKLIDGEPSDYDFDAYHDQEDRERKG